MNENLECFWFVIRHGYHFHYFTKPFKRKNEHGRKFHVTDGWGKISATWEVMQRAKQNSWIWWVDLDLVVMNFNVTFVSKKKLKIFEHHF